ncbi:unnamed protein product [Cladocopium goreaui]|uniref:Guanylate cyclase domain-containing protein n=1 Tax=Cladocopium goreaui TaxID=2562237 RepID=A0A9P1G8J9_9DINO|nr:unnamed protein product [Cladocopium goreaui]
MMAPPTPSTPPNGSKAMKSGSQTQLQIPMPGNRDSRSTDPSTEGPKITVTNSEEVAKGPTTPRSTRTNPKLNKNPSKNSKNRRQLPLYIWLSRKIVDNTYFMVFTTILTFYALTADDLRIILTEKPADIVFNLIGLLCITVFSCEVVLSCLGKVDYLCSFFFLLDVISTATLLLDLTWISEAIQGDNSDASDLRSGRTARVGARASRVVRVLRLVRILKLYKAYYEAKQRKAERERRKQQGELEDDWDEADYEALENGHTRDTESRVGKKLSEMTTRRVICLILAMLLCLPLLSKETADQTPYSATYGANHVWEGLSVVAPNAESTSSQHQSSASAALFLGSLFWFGLAGQSTDTSFTTSLEYTQMTSGVLDSWVGSTREDYLTAYGTMPSSIKASLSEPWGRQCATSSQDLVGVSLIDTEVQNANYYKIYCPLDLRLTEIQAYAPSLMQQGQTPYLTFYFDMRPFNRTTALFGLSNTFFVMILLVTASLMFTNDANRLVLRPVEKMIGRIEAIRDKPLLAMKMADDEFKAEEIAKERLQRARKKPWNRICWEISRLSATSRNEVMETVILEKTIIKLGSLLALGFGEAGADIIGKNMSGSDSAGVNAMVPGRKCECIVGVMRVRDFSTATEVLQSKVMMFSNQIAEIVHGVCNEFHGAPNKNTGETFLVIWKQSEDSGLDSEALMAKFAEGSIVSSAAVIGAVHRSPLLGSYREHPGLQYRLGSKCRVHLSIGLHKGWAIEGAVGSEFKIDCSYLSPNVSIATSIERSTEVYNVSVIVAQSVIDLVSYNMRCQLRLIDRVVIRGSPAPMELYCVDLDYMSIELDLTLRPKVPWNTRQRFKVRQWMEQEKNAVLQKDLAEVFETDEVIAQMRECFTVEFFQLFNMGYQNYSQGEWQVARRMLMEIKSRLAPDDGPSSALLKFMEFPHDFDAPTEWMGVRDLVGY